MDEKKKNEKIRDGRNVKVKVLSFKIGLNWIEGHHNYAFDMAHVNIIYLIFSTISEKDTSSSIETTWPAK